jgi:hypothetical protein
LITGWKLLKFVSANTISLLLELFMRVIPINDLVEVVLRGVVHDALPLIELRVVQLIREDFHRGHIERGDLRY